MRVEYSVFVAKPDQTNPVGELAAYQCVENLHIFFLMSRDIEDAQELRRA